jgi:two-component system, cell cycle sensor histidine kinase and response regulator CckA
MCGLSAVRYGSEWIMPDSLKRHGDRTHDRTEEVSSLVLDELRELQQIYDYAPCGYHSLDQHGVFTRINETELAMLGYDRADIISQKKFPDLLTPESQKIFAANFAKFKQQGWVRDLPFDLIRKDGTILSVSLSATAIYDADGNYHRSRSIIVDISHRLAIEVDRQASELALNEAHQRILDVWESMTDAYITLDRDWRFIYANSAAAAIFSQFKLDPAAMIGMDYWTVFPDDTDEGGEHDFRRSVREQVPVHFERRYDVTNEWFEVHAYPSAVGLGVYFRNITEKKQLESQLLRAQRLESLGTLASGIAHDLNNVLTPIIGVVQLLPIKVRSLDPQVHRLLEILGESARRGADLVQQILSFTRGADEGDRQPQTVKPLLVEIEKIIHHTFPKNITLAIDCPSNLGLVTADATLLHQVLMNLCINARDAMPNGGRLSITTENVTIDDHYARINLDAQIGEYVMITIADTGMGIPAVITDRIFEPFFTTKAIGKGTGLGLSTVMSIIKNHGGFINVYSEVGNGTRFKIYLPATDSHTTEALIDRAIPGGAGELILVVDDELAVQEITQVTLETHGYKAMTANDGIEAIALYAEHKQAISVILLDLMMPSLDAVTTIRTLNKLNPGVKIVAMSGLAANESMTKTMDVGDIGVQAFLAKPFTTSKLLEVLAQLHGRDTDRG